MTIGDRVLVTYTNGEQLVGLIIGETEKMWNIDFDGEEKTRRVRKAMDIQLLEDALEEDEIEDEIEDIFEDDLELMDEYEDVEEPTEEEFETPVGESKPKKWLVAAAIVIMAAIVTLVALAVFNVI